MKTKFVTHIKKATREIIPELTYHSRVKKKAH